MDEISGGERMSFNILFGKVPREGIREMKIRRKEYEVRQSKLM